MLPFSLRVIWFLLSLTGTLACWVVFIPFCRITERYWPLYYCLGCTLTQGIFWMGMIYKMDPFMMSRSFCISQLITISLGVYIMTGIIATFVMATTYASYKPKIWKEGQKGIMIWRPLYVFSSYIFPIVASGVQLAMMSRFDRRGRSDNLFYDYSDPTWLRFFAYVGTPWSLIIPCLYLSITSLVRIHKTNDHLERSRDPDIDIEHLTELPRRLPRVRMTRVSLVSSRPSDRQTSSSTLAVNGEYHGHPIPATVTLDTFSNSSIQASMESGSRHSSSFPTFTSVPRIGVMPIDTDRISVSSTISIMHLRDEWREILGASHTSTMSMDQAGSDNWHDVGGKVEGKEEDESVTEDDCSSMPPPPTRRSTLSRNPRKILPVLPLDTYRVIYFQIAFAGIQALCSISSIVDVARGGTPAPFGTQHIALLMWAWAPAVFFVRWRDIRKRCSRWFTRV